MLAYESVSTWRQPEPAPASAHRTALIEEIADRVAQRGPGRLSVAVDGYTASGKTSFGHELAAALRRRGRPTLRACLDDFKKPWHEARELGYDRVSGEGYYRNAYDHRAAQELLLGPMRPDGSGTVVLCARDPLTGEDHHEVAVQAPADAILVVDSVFAFRPEYNDFWDFRIWLDVEPEQSLSRGIARDAEREGVAEAERVHRDRYHAAELIYLAEVGPRALADAVVDNRDFARPRIVTAGDGRPPGATLVLRSARADDAAAVAEIWYHGWGDGHFGHVPDALVAARTRESFGVRAAQRVDDTVVATLGGEVAGFVMVVGDEVEQVYLSARHRGTGVAGALLAEAERLVRANGHARAWLAVAAGNDRARRFYARNGWIDEGAFTYAAADAAGPIPVSCHRYVKTVAGPGPA